jgi:hypothetical protein
MRGAMSGSTSCYSAQGDLPRKVKLVKEREDDASQLNRLNHYFRRAPSKFYGQVERAISTRKLKQLPVVHSEPIKQVVFLCPSYPLRVGRSYLGECFTLICIQRLSQPNFATQPCR